MNATKPYCSLNPMEEKRENLWSECFQDLGSWCPPPQDELNTPIVINDQREFSFDDQSMYYSWEANSSSVDLKGDMWKPQTDLLSFQFNTEEDNNNTKMQTLEINKSTHEAGIRYSGNLLLTQCPYDIDTDLDNSQNTNDQINWNKIQKFQDTNSLNPLYTAPPRQDDFINKSITSLKPSRKPKPSLKLNIAAANKVPSNQVDNPPSFGLDTPDVLKSLAEDSDFSILSYVCEGDDQNLLAVNPSTIIQQRPKESQCVADQVIKTDHDYAEVLPDEPVVFDNLDNCKKEELLPYEEKVFSLSPVKEEPSSPTPSTSKNLGKRVRKSTAQSDDYIFDDDLPSDNSSDWSPVSKKQKMQKRANKKKVCEKPVKRARTPSVSDSGSVTSGPDRYRELRDRNNEASRRSRQNRKQRETEMLETAATLESENVLLKAKAISLEKRVKTLRGILLRVVLDKNK